MSQFADDFSHTHKTRDGNRESNWTCHTVSQYINSLIMYLVTKHTHTHNRVGAGHIQTTPTLLYLAPQTETCTEIQSPENELLLSFSGVNGYKPVGSSRC